MKTSGSAKTRKRWVAHCRRDFFHVYIGRPSIWGNPFKITRDMDRDAAIEAYRQWLDGQPELKERARQELKGKVLGCYCAPLACHGDVLAEIANEVREVSEVSEVNEVSG